MPDPEQLSEDRGLKELFTSYPLETLEILVPALLAERGRPTRVVPVTQESALPDLGEPSRFLDLALRCEWATGKPTFILLVEHWSEARKVHLDRILFYLVALRLKHDGAEVLPVVLVTDPGDREVPQSLESMILGLPVFTFHVRIERIGPDLLPRLRSLQNLVAAVLSALAYRRLHQDAVDVLIMALRLMAASHAPVDEIRRYLPLAAKLAKMQDKDEPRFRRRLSEDPTVGNVLDDMKAEGMALGEARGLARGKVLLIRQMATQGQISIDQAKRMLNQMIATGEVPAAIGEDGLRQLG